jgi:hypothetical protein
MSLDVKMLHLRYEGTSREIPFTDLGVADGAADTAIKSALANFLDVPADDLRNYTVSRESGGVVVHPVAVYG